MAFNLARQKCGEKARLFERCISEAIETLEKERDSLEEQEKIYKKQGLSGIADNFRKRTNRLSGVIYVFRHELLPIVRRKTGYKG